MQTLETCETANDYMGIFSHSVRSHSNRVLEEQPVGHELNGWKCPGKHVGMVTDPSWYECQSEYKWKAYGVDKLTGKVGILVSE